MSRSNSKISLENALVELLQAQFGENPLFTGVSFYSAQRSGEKTLPSVVVSCPDLTDAVHEVAAYQGDVHVAITSSVDEDGNPEDNSTLDPKHQDRVTEVEAILDEVDQVIAYINANSPIKIYGYYVSGSSRVTEGRAFADIITINVTFQPIE